MTSTFKKILLFPFFLLILFFHAGNILAEDSVARFFVLSQTISDPDPNDSLRFGAKVAMDGDIALVSTSTVMGQAKVYVFHRNDQGSWLQETKFDISDPNRSSYANESIEIALKGDTVLVGAGHFNEGKGAAYMFTRNADASWTRSQDLLSYAVNSGYIPYLQKSTAWGGSIALSSNEVMISGCHNSTELNETRGFFIFTFIRNADGSLSGVGPWRPWLDNSGVCESRAMSVDKKTIMYSSSVVSSSDVVDVVEVIDTENNRRQTLFPADSLDPFSRGVALQDDTALIGGLRNAYIFRRNTSSSDIHNYFPWVQEQVLGPFPKFKFYYENHLMNLALDSNTALIHIRQTIPVHFGHDVSKQKIYVFTHDAQGKWSQHQEINLPDIVYWPAPEIALSQNTFLVTDLGADPTNSKVHVYNKIVNLEAKPNLQFNSQLSPLNSDTPSNKPKPMYEKKQSPISPAYWWDYMKRFWGK